MANQGAIAGNVTEILFTNVVLQLPADTANKFCQMMLDLRTLMASFPSDGNQVEVLWSTSILQPGSTMVNKLCDCLMNLQAYTSAHSGDPTGFSYMPTSGSNWWDGKSPHFQALANQNAHGWWVNGAGAIEQGVADLPPARTLKDGDVMDVWAVVKPNNQPPTWFVAYPEDYLHATKLLVFLAGETHDPNNI